METLAVGGGGNGEDRRLDSQMKPQTFEGENLSAGGVCVGSVKSEGRKEVMSDLQLSLRWLLSVHRVHRPYCLWRINCGFRHCFNVN